MPIRTEKKRLNAITSMRYWKSTVSALSRSCSEKAWPKLSRPTGASSAIAKHDKNSRCKRKTLNANIGRVQCKNGAKRFVMKVNNGTSRL